MTTTDNVHLLRPVPSSLGVSVHPHPGGDVISVQWVDTNGHRYLMATDPATAHQIGLGLIEATTSETVAAQADTIRNRQ